MELTRRQVIGGAAASGMALAGVSAALADEAPAASGFRSWEVAPEPIPEDQIVRVIDADIAILGGGLGGVCCAQSAAEEGAKVVVLEKTGQVNGRGKDLGTIGNRYQKEHPEVAEYIDATVAEKTWYEDAHCTTNRLLFKHWVNNSGAAFDHLADYLSEKYGYGVYLSDTAHIDRWDGDPYYREMPTCQCFGEGWYDEDGNWWMVGVLNKIYQWAVDLGAEFIFNAPAQQLVTDADGRVTGVIASTEDGYIQVNAAKGVIIATGDISGSEEMMREWCPTPLRAVVNIYNPEGGNTGDGIRMALQIGAGMQHGFAAPMIHPIAPQGPFAQNGDRRGFLCVNREGERYTIEYNNIHGMANSLLVQPGGEAYTIFDANFAEYALRMSPGNMSVEGTPIVDENTQAKVDAAVEARDGLCFRADTLEELAEQVGLPVDTFTASVARYNELVAAGEDTDMGLEPDLLSPIDTPPFYASRIGQAILVVIYGLNCDSHSRVCDVDDRPIPGLYAVGNAQGNFFAVDYPLVCPGISHGRCLTFGYTLPKAMLKDELI